MRGAQGGAPERAGALLRVLSAAAAHAQVIVFSHHERLIGVAERAIGRASFGLHRIEPVGVGLAA